MAEITASMVKDLREKTGAGMMDAKKALTESNGDMDAAMEYLRKKGLATADKKSSRTAAEGLVAKIRDSLSAFLTFIAEEPAFADMCIVEVMAAGPAAIERRNQTMAAFATMIEKAAADELPKSKLPPALTAETLVGGIYEVVYSRVLGGRGEELPSLLPTCCSRSCCPTWGRRPRARCSRTSAAAASPRPAPSRPPTSPRSRNAGFP